MLPLLFYGLAASHGFVFKIFASRVMVFLGAISYCIYMVHYPVLEFASAIFSDYLYKMDPSGSQGVLWLFLGGITIVSSYRLYSALLRD